MKKNNLEKLRIDNLQMLRGFAASLVVISHSLGNYLTWMDKGGAFEERLGIIGWLGVAIFFAISGFIMLYGHNNDYEKKGATVSFYKKRIIRIVPLYWVFTLVVATKLILQSRDIESIDFIKSLLFIPYLNHEGFWRPIHQLGWTLNFEMYFYFFFGISLFFSRKNGLLLLAIAIISPIIFGLFYKTPIFYSNPIALYFLIGMAIFFVKDRFNLIFKNIDNSFKLITLTLMIILGVIYLNNLSLIILAAAVLPAIAIFSSNEIALPNSILAMGNASYSIYLVHTLVIGILFQVFQKTFPIPNYIGMIFYVTLALVISLVAGFISYVFIEKSITKKLR